MYQIKKVFYFFEKVFNAVFFRQTVIAQFAEGR